MSRRASKRLRGLPTGHSASIDWYVEVFASEDLLPLLLAQLHTLEDFVALGATCAHLRDETVGMRKAGRMVMDPHEAVEFKEEKGPAGAMCACMTGDLRIVRFAHERIGPLDMQGAMGAAGMGYLHVLGYLKALGYTMDPTVACMAAQYDQLASLHWLQLFDYPILVSAIHHAAARGALGCLKGFFDGSLMFAMTKEDYQSRTFVDLPWAVSVHETLVGVAAANGHLDTVRALCEWGCSITVRNAATAADAGEIEVLKYMAERRSEAWGLSVIKPTLRNGDFATFKYCYELFGDTLDPGPLMGLAVRPPAEPKCLEYLLERGCPYDQDDIRCALMREDQPALIRVFAAAGHVWEPSHLTSAVILGHYGAAEVLRCELGVEWPSNAITRLICKGEFGKFVWALKHGASASEHEVNHACIENQPSMLEMLLDLDGCKGTVDALILCVRNCSIRCAEIMCAHMGMEWTKRMESELRLYLQYHPKAGGEAFLDAVFG